MARRVLVRRVATRLRYRLLNAQKGTLEMKNLLARLWQEEEGQDLTEYALLVVLVGLGSILAMGSLASAISDAFSKAAANMTAT